MIMLLRALLLAALAFPTVHALAAGEISGAGSSLSATLVGELAQDYRRLRNVEVDYKAVGSGEGIRRIAAGSVDFALTDVPLTQYELELLGAEQFPVFFSGLVPVVNLPGLSAQRVILDGAALAAIYQGRIRNWRDPHILGLNPGLDLPGIDIVPVFRADSSGSSYIFTSYLAQASAEWKTALGVGSKLEWPTGREASGTAGLLDLVRGTPGALGYAEFGDATRSGVAIARLAGPGGTAIEPGPESFGQVIAKARWDRPSLRRVLVDARSAQGWPMVATTYALLRRQAAESEDLCATVAFLDWMLVGHDPVFEALGILPLRSAPLLASIHHRLDELAHVR